MLPQVELAPSETSLYALLAGIAAVLSLVTVMPAFRVARCYYEATVHHAVNPATQYVEHAAPTTRHGTPLTLVAQGAAACRVLCATLVDCGLDPTHDGQPPGTKHAHHANRCPPPNTLTIGATTAAARGLGQVLSRCHRS